jgi:hypothetical protein
MTPYCIKKKHSLTWFAVCSSFGVSNRRVSSSSLAVSLGPFDYRANQSLPQDFARPTRGRFIRQRKYLASPRLLPTTPTHPHTQTYIYI